MENQIRKYKPVTSTRRHTVLLKTIKKEKGLKVPSKLVQSQKYSAGRSGGRIATRHKGGRCKRKIRVIDFKRDKYDIEGRVESIMYDPNRTCNIALVVYPDGEKRFILATKNMKKGTKVISSDKAPFKEGNAMPIGRVPSGFFVHNVELTKGKGGVLGRSAGIGIQVQGNVKDYVQLKMPSGEIRLVRAENYATLGEIGNEMHSRQKIGKAGRNRHKGKRPSVRGVAMSWGHPHAGGQGKSGRVGTGGPAKNPWGLNQGTKTRKNKGTNKYIVQKRKTKRRPHVSKYKTIV